METKTRIQIGRSGGGIKPFHVYTISVHTYVHHHVMYNFQLVLRDTEDEICKIN